LNSHARQSIWVALERQNWKDMGEPDTLSTLRPIPFSRGEELRGIGDPRRQERPPQDDRGMRIGLTSAPRFRLRGEPAFFGFLLAGELGQLIGNRHYHTLRGEEFSLRFAFEVEEFRHGSGHGGQAQI